jgi:hypothetical protein
VVSPHPLITMLIAHQLNDKTKVLTDV